MCVCVLVGGVRREGGWSSRVRGSHTSAPPNSNLQCSVPLLAYDTEWGEGEGRGEVRSEEDTGEGEKEDGALASRIEREQRSWKVCVG